MARAEVVIDAPIERVWAAVSDPTRYEQWSPETSGARWVTTGAAPEVGSRFRGTNRRGPVMWWTTCTVTDFDPGQRFGFAVRSGPIPVSHWSYALEAAEGGTRVVETSTDDRTGIAGGLLKGFSVVALRVRDRERHNAEQMTQGLRALKALLEAPPSAR